MLFIFGLLNDGKFNVKYEENNKLKLKTIQPKYIEPKLLKVSVDFVCAKRISQYIHLCAVLSIFGQRKDHLKE